MLAPHIVVENVVVEVLFTEGGEEEVEEDIMEVGMRSWMWQQ